MNALKKLAPRAALRLSGVITHVIGAEGITACYWGTPENLMLVRVPVGTPGSVIVTLPEGVCLDESRFAAFIKHAAATRTALTFPVEFRYEFAGVTLTTQVPRYLAEVRITPVRANSTEERTRTVAWIEEKPHARAVALHGPVESYVAWLMAHAPRRALYRTDGFAFMLANLTVCRRETHVQFERQLRADLAAGNIAGVALPAEIISGLNHVLSLDFAEWLQFATEVQQQAIFPTPEAYREARARTITTDTLIIGFVGKELAVSTLLLARELETTGTRYLVLDAPAQDSSAAVADVPVDFFGLNCQIVAPESQEFYELLATAGEIVVNDTLPAWFTAREGQVIHQLWHGKPLKHIGKDHPLELSSAVYRDIVATQPKMWDRVYAHDQECARLFKQAFDLSGSQVANMGANPLWPYLGQARAAADLRQSVRRRLGVTDETPIVLYAPTWYDAPLGWDTDGNEQLRRLWEVDIAPRLAQLGSFPVAKFHHRAAQGKQDFGIHELLIAADLVITDYSSVMFDAAACGVPVVRFVPFSEHYEKLLRGLYPVARPGREASEVPALLELVTEEFATA